MQYLWVETEHFCVFRRRDPEDAGIDALPLQEGIIAFLAPDNANNPLKGVPKATIQYGSRISRKAYRFFGADGAFEFCYPKLFEHGDPNKSWILPLTGILPKEQLAR
ncbi:MAG: hypothetical protein JETT_1987 [Candidatus Jettenia ecosi]|uniref:Uncharacterized protein n=1 Tax=Candidatus Jettenia ecosi TaxID=2494326 RepID=A0A533QAT0_9BACT|nr:MAG: hypothetical protein JETT_1987 [Candidatus Jettenia ecosi]